MITDEERAAYKVAYSLSYKSPQGFCKATIDAMMASMGHRRWYADGLSSENAPLRSQKKSRKGARSPLPVSNPVRLKADGTPDRRCKGAFSPLATPVPAKTGSLSLPSTSKDVEELDLAKMRDQAATMRALRIAAAKQELAEAQERLSKLLA